MTNENTYILTREQIEAVRDIIRVKLGAPTFSAPYTTYANYINQIPPVHPREATIEIATDFFYNMSDWGAFNWCDSLQIIDYSKYLNMSRDGMLDLQNQRLYYSPSQYSYFYSGQCYMWPIFIAVAATDHNDTNAYVTSTVGDPNNTVFFAVPPSTVTIFHNSSNALKYSSPDVYDKLLLTEEKSANVKSLAWAFDRVNVPIHHAICFNNVIFFNGAYREAKLINTYSVCGPNVLYFHDTYWNSNVEYASCGENVIDMGFAFEYCENLRNCACGNNVVNMSYTYMGCNNITEAVCGPNVRIMDHTYSSCPNLVTAACGDNVTNMYYAYNSCYNLKYGACGDNVINMYEAYNNCTNLITGWCGNNVLNMYYAYEGCTNLTESYCGPNVTIMNYAYKGCSNLKTANVGPNVQHMASAFYNCTNINGYVNIPNTLLYCSYAFYNTNIEGFKFDDSKTYTLLQDGWDRKYFKGMNGLGSYCKNLQYINFPNASFGTTPSNIFSAMYAYANCVAANVIIPDGWSNLANFCTYVINQWSNVGMKPGCGRYITNMANAYQNGRELIVGNPVCGDNVLDMAYCYWNSYSLEGDPVCGKNVVNMAMAYYNCPNVCGNFYILSHNVTNASLCLGSRNSTSKYVNIYANAIDGTSWQALLQSGYFGESPSGTSRIDSQEYNLSLIPWED